VFRKGRVSPHMPYSSKTTS